MVFEEIFLLPWQYWAMLITAIGITIGVYYLEKQKIDFLERIINILKMVANIQYAVFAQELIKRYGKYIYETQSNRIVEDTLDVITETPMMAQTQISSIEQNALRIEELTTRFNQQMLLINIVVGMVILMIVCYFGWKEIKEKNN